MKTFDHVADERMEDIHIGQCSQHALSPVEQECASEHGTATILNHGLRVITALFSEKTGKLSCVP